jgi:hypothetical protein
MPYLRRWPEQTGRAAALPSRRVPGRRHEVVKFHTPVSLLVRTKTRVQKFEAPPNSRYGPLKRQLVVKVRRWSSRSTIKTTNTTIAHTTVTSFEVIGLRRGRWCGTRNTTP